MSSAGRACKKHGIVWFAFGRAPRHLVHTAPAPRADGGGRGGGDATAFFRLQRVVSFPVPSCQSVCREWLIVHMCITIVNYLRTAPSTLDLHLLEPLLSTRASSQGGVV